MTPAAAARVLVILGWLGGISLVLDGSLILGLAALVLACAAAGTFRWRGAWLRGQWLAMRLRMKARRAARTGGAVERA